VTLVVAGDSAAGLTLGTGTTPLRHLKWLGGETFGIGSTRYTFGREGKGVSTLRVDDVFSNWVFTRNPVASIAASEPVRDLPLAAEERRPFAGLYAMTTGAGLPPSAFCVYEEGGSLMGQLRTNDPTRLMYQGGNAFRPSASPEFKIVFTVSGGRATQVAIVSPDVTMNGVRDEPTLDPNRPRRACPQTQGEEAH
jgi:hypothetical protein